MKGSTDHAASNSKELPFRLGYLVPEFPTQTHNFFWKEIGALRSLGVVVHLYSTRAPEAAKSPHPFREEAIRETTYLFPPSTLEAICFALLHPGKIGKAVRYVNSLTEASFGEKIRLLALIPSAVALLHSCGRKGVNHIHCHSCATAAHLVNICHRMGGPTFSLSLHGDLPVYGRDHTEKMSEARFVACVTKPLQRDVVKLTGKPLEQVPVIRMGVDTTLFAPNPPHQDQSAKLTLVTVARLNPSKGIEHALNALFEAKKRGYEFAYFVAGDGPDRQRLEAMIERLELGSSVSLLGTTGEKDVIDLLHRADVFVLPSTGLGEAAPVSVMEAMACGLPVICSLIGGTPDMISDGVDGFLVPQRDEKGLMEAFIHLADDAVLRKSLGEHARARAVSEFDHIEMAKQLLLYIRSAAK